MSRIRLDVLRRREPLRLGFLPVSDCAPLVYAAEGGLFQKYELEVELQREASWAAVRDKVIQGDLDAAQVPATLPFLANIGLESDPCACVSGMVLSLQGNAITVSRDLWENGVGDAHSLRELIYRRWRKRAFTFGVGFPYSSAYLLLHQWLRSAGIKPETEVRIVVIPPIQMYPTLKLGYIDGYCVGEPWSSLAVQAGVGVCVATSSVLAPMHPEKILMVRQSFATGRPDEHERLLAALLEACEFCDQPRNRPLLSDMLAHPGYVNAPAECLRAGLVGPQESDGVRLRDDRNLTVFHQGDANDPSDDKAAWIMNSLYEVLEQSPFAARCPDRTPVLKNVFRRDIFQRAKATIGQEQRSIERETRAARL